VTNDGRFEVGDVLPMALSATELRRGLGFRRTKFWELERAGAFKHLRVDDELAGARIYSGAKVAAVLAGTTPPPGRSLLRSHRQRTQPHAARPREKRSERSGEESVQT
jgi:hypothetical protein